MKKGSIIRIIASQPVDDQEGIDSYIGREFEVIEHWKQKDSYLENGQVTVILFDDVDLNPRQQLSILNKEEYIEVK
jgi:hypothetical protein